MLYAQWKKKQSGMAVLSVTMVVLAIVTIITFFSARIIVTDNKIYQNQENAADAFNAAQAGVDYALGFINSNITNRNNVLVAAVASNGLASCASSSSTTCLSSGSTLGTCSPAAVSTLSNGATYTMQYSCVSAGSSTLTISSVGKSQDGTSTRTIKVQVNSYPQGTQITFPLLTTSTVNNISSKTNITNNASGATVGVRAGGAITITGTGFVQVAGVSYITPNAAQVYQNYPGLSSITSTVLQQTYLGDTITNLGATADYTGTYGGNRKFTSVSSDALTGTGAPTRVSGVVGKVVYLNMNNGANTATINGTFSAGSTTQPILIIVNGNVSLANTAKITGSLYATGTITFANAANVVGFVFGGGAVTLGDSTAGVNDVNGAVISGANVNLNGSGNILFSTTDTLNSLRYSKYGIVSGSWRDF